MRPIDADDIKDHISELILVYSGTELDNAILNAIDNAPTIRYKSMREFFMSEQLRPRRYCVRDRSYHFERGYRLGKLRGYSEGLEKGMSFYNETAAKIRELIWEGGKK